MCPHWLSLYFLRKDNENPGLAESLSPCPFSGVSPSSIDRNGRRQEILLAGTGLAIEERKWRRETPEKKRNKKAT